MSSVSDRAGYAMLLLLAGAASCQPRSTANMQAPGSRLASIGPEPGPGESTEVAPVNPFSGDRTVLADGRRLFNWFNCSGCHGDHGGGGMGPSLRDSLWYYGGSDAQIFASITQGRDKGMPAWGPKIPEEQRWRIVTYIKSMRTSNEPDPPR